MGVVRPLPSADDPFLKWDFCFVPLPGMGRPLPSANDPCLKMGFSAGAPARNGLVAGQALGLCKRPLPEIGFSASVLARNGLVAGQALALRKRPLPEMGFFAGVPALVAGPALAICKRPLPEMGFFCLRPCQKWACFRSSPCPLQTTPALNGIFCLPEHGTFACGPVEGACCRVRPLPSSNGPCMK